MDSSSPIGIFDSGMGGISVLKTIHELMPNENLIFFGDSKYNPYGTKTKEEITERCIAICDELIKKDVKAIVVACNTATSACVDILRKKYPIDIIGMEPALKVACDNGKHQRIAVWATDFTLKEKKFANLMKKFENDHEIIKVACPKLVRIVEQNQLKDSDIVKKALQEYVSVSTLNGLNSIVLGCTHFPFFKEYLEKMVPETVMIIDGNLGTSIHLKNTLEKRSLLNENKEGTIAWMNSSEDKISFEEELFNYLNK